MLATLGVLLRLCCHPALIPQYVVRADDGSTKLAPELPAIDDDGELPLEDGDAEDEDGGDDDDDSGASARKASSNSKKTAAVGPARTFGPLHELLDGSSKLVFVRHLVPKLVRDGHRVLLFSQSKVMLDLTCCLLSHLVRGRGPGPRSGRGPWRGPRQGAGTRAGSRARGRVGLGPTGGTSDTCAVCSLALSRSAGPSHQPHTRASRAPHTRAPHTGLTRSPLMLAPHAGPKRSPLTLAPHAGPSRSLRALMLAHTVQGLRFVRMDGDITDRKERQKRINEFQRDSTIPCFVLTTGVGGVGLNLVGADRVILMDPAWNPAKDAQAVDRAYRMGQTRPVIVYRLNTCGTVEEKVFRRQVFKASLMRNTTTKAASSQRYVGGWRRRPGSGLGRFVRRAEPCPRLRCQHRYFTKDDLKARFTLGNSEVSRTHEQLVEVHGVAILEQAGQPGLREHIDQIKECPGTKPHVQP